MNTPTSPAGQAPSYKTNVNRAKTKRWVEAKSYSYDGDDWGDVDDYDEYGGYDDPEPEPAPKPTGLRQRGQSASQSTEGVHGRMIPQAPSSHETPPGPHHVPTARQSGNRNISTPAMDQQARLQKMDTFENEGNRRAFSAGPTDQHLPLQQDQHIQPQDFQPASAGGYPHQPSQPAFSPPSGHSPSRPSVDNGAGRGPHQSSASSFRGPQPADQAHIPNPDSRAQSFTSNTSATGFMDRRDFSPSAMPPPLQTRNSPSPHDNLQGRPPRKSSLGQQSQPSLPFDPHAPPSVPYGNRAEGQSRSRTGSSASGGQSLAFVRPADIYKRMEEERERERQSQESSRPSLDALVGKPPERPIQQTKVENESAQRLKLKLDPVTERKSEYGFEGLNANNQSRRDHQGSVSEHGKHEEKRRTTSKTFDLPESTQPSASHNSSLSPGLTLPDPSRISGWGQGFGESFMGSRDSDGHFSKDLIPDPPVDSSPEKPKDIVNPNEETDLRHQQSKGFKSAVHQAFDTAQEQVPPTPSSNADSSIGRSASGGTSTVSPIMSRGPSAADKDRTHELPSIDDVTTPTQEDDNNQAKTRQRASGSFATLTQAAPPSNLQNEEIEAPPPGFKMGHRRESGTPSPDNSPARMPVLASMSHLRHPHEADLAQTTPTPTDSVPSKSNSMRESERSLDDYQQSEPQNTRRTETIAAKPSTDSPSSRSLPFSPNRTDSSGSGRVKNLVENFENSSRPDSAQSNTTPRASVLGPHSGAQTSHGDARPSNERMESFRPQLPGGWESSASIMPSKLASQPDSATDRSSNSKVQAEGGQLGETPSSPGNEQSWTAQTRDASNSAFAAAAQAGNALAGALMPASGQGEVSKGKEPSRDNSNAPTPLPKDTPRQESSSSDYFAATGQRESSNEPSKVPGIAKQPSSLPSLSTDVQPEQYESDRLRREIVKELGSEPTTAESGSSYQASSRYPTNESVVRHPTNDSAYSNDPAGGALPSDYDRYWNDGSEDALSRESSYTGDAKPALQDGKVDYVVASADNKEAHPESSQEPASSSQLEDRPHSLERRFSWEQPLAELSPSTHAKQQLGPSQAPATREMPVTDSFHTQVPLRDSPVESQNVSTNSPNPTLTPVLDNTHNANGHLASGKMLETPLDSAAKKEVSYDNLQSAQSLGYSESPEAVIPQPLTHPARTIEDPSERSFSDRKEQDSPWGVAPEPKPSAPQATTPMHGQPLPAPPPPSSDIPKLPAFREIMALKTPQERIHAFAETQQKFADLNTGLAHWLATTVDALPEHGDLVSSGGRYGNAGPGHKASPSRSKTGQPYYQQYLDASPQPPPGVNAPVGSGPGPNQSQGFSPSGNKISSQQVQAKSKEFLHTAGVFGGKANTAAKGLFSKGKSKLRDASGSKKAPRSTSTAPTSASRGMQPDHATFQARGNHAPNAAEDGQASLPLNEADSEHDAPSVQSITQSQLADDERSEEDKADRLPRSSKIYRKRDSSSHRNSRRTSHPAESTAPIDQATSTQVSEPFTDPGTSPSSPELQKHTPTQATFDHSQSSRYAEPRPASPASPVGISDPKPDQQKKQANRDSRMSSSSAFKVLKSRYFTRSPTRVDTAKDDEMLGSQAIHLSSAEHPQPVQKPRSSHRSGSDTSVGARSPIQSRQNSNILGGSVTEEQQARSMHEAADMNEFRHSHSEYSPTHQALAQTLEVPKHANGVNGIPDTHQALSRDLSRGRPSMESLPSHVDPDRPPSPISPQLPIQMSTPPRGRPIVPVHHGIEHNFVNQDSQDEAQRRSRSYSRPFNRSEERRRSGITETPNVPLQQPRPSTDDVAIPAGFYPGTISREEALVPRSQGSEYALEGVGPPEVPPKDSEPRSRRGSRSSAFLKSLAKSITDSDSPSVPNSAADQGHGSPAMPAASATPKSKRSSIWGFRKSQIDLTNENTKSTSNTELRPGISRTSTDVIQFPAPVPPPKQSAHVDDDEFPMRPKQRTPTGFSKKMHRASTSGSKEPEGGKKNRLSALGSLFGRSGHRRTSSSKHSRKSSEDQPRKPSQPSLPSMQENLNRSSTQVAQLSEPQPRPQAAPTVSEPPLGGYYAPKRRTSQQPQHVPTAHINRNPTSPQRQASAGPKDLPAYVEASSLRQNSPPAVSPRGGRGSRASIDLLRKGSQAEQKEALPTAQRRESKNKGSVWGRLSVQGPSKGRSPQSGLSANEPLASQYNSFGEPLQQPEVAQRYGQQIHHPASPPPPPPPPKDEWHRTTPRRSSLATNHQTPSPATATLSQAPGPTSPNERQRYALPPLQTDVPSPHLNQRYSNGQQSYILPPLQTEIPTPHLGTIKSGFSSSTPKTATNTPGMSYEDRRRSRQMEIETGHMSPGGTPMSPQEKRRSRQMEIETSHLKMAGDSAPMSPQEKRRSRQMEIETGHLSPGGGPSSPKAQTTGLGLRQVQEDRDTDEEPIRMSATSFPGQEWAPY